MSLLVNLYGGPGTGKSTTATGVFSKLKLAGVNCEYVSEYAKDLVWEERTKTFDNQLYLFAKQYHRIKRVYNKVDVVITDCPIILSAVYGNETYIFKKLVLEKHAEFTNMDVFLKRSKKYNPIGRNQTESEARVFDSKISRFMLQNKIPFFVHEADETVIEILSDKISKTLMEK